MLHAAPGAASPACARGAAQTRMQPRCNPLATRSRAAQADEAARSAKSGRAAARDEKQRLKDEEREAKEAQAGASRELFPEGFRAFSPSGLLRRTGPTGPDKFSRLCPPPGRARALQRLSDPAGEGRAGESARSRGGGGGGGV